MKHIYLHRPNLVIKADFSSEKPPIYRYRLEAIKEGSSNNPRTVCAVMQNPSYACVEIADRSVQMLQRLIFEKDIKDFDGIERLIVVNLFAFIQTKDFASTDDEIGNPNDDAIANAVDESEIVLIAWGKNKVFKKRQKHILEIVCASGRTLLQTRMHPSRVIYEGFIQKYPLL